MSLSARRGVRRFARWLLPGALASMLAMTAISTRSQATSAATPTRGELVTGAKTPERISDDMVVREVLRVWLTVPLDNAPSRQRFRRQLDRVALSAPDRAALEREVMRLRPTMAARQGDVTAVAQATRLPENAAPEARAAISVAFQRSLSARDTFLKTSHQDLQRALSPEGAERLRTFLQREKRFIFYYLAPPERTTR